MTRHFYIHYKPDSDESDDIEEFFKHITSPPAVNSYIAATMNGAEFTANLPDGCLIAWFPEEFTPEMVYHFFQNAVSASRVKFQTLTCVEVAPGTVPYFGHILP